MNLQKNQYETNTNKLHGTVEGIYYGQNERVDELNTRIYDRNFPDSPLEPNFDPRPIPTKYSQFPIINRRTPVHESAIHYLNYNSRINFNPGTKSAPRSGFVNNIDLETFLRNQTFALQNGTGQDVYVPSSDSDLYKVQVQGTQTQNQNNPEQPYPLLFNSPVFNQSIHPNMVNSNVGKEQFFNHTRSQLRDT